MVKFGDENELTYIQVRMMICNPKLFLILINVSELPNFFVQNMLPIILLIK